MSTPAQTFAAKLPPVTDPDLAALSAELALAPDGYRVLAGRVKAVVE